MLTTRITELETVAEREVVEAIEELIVASGVSRQTIVTHLSGSEGEPRRAEVIYRHPKTGQIWRGRGRKPNWIKEFEAQGGLLSALAEDAKPENSRRTCSPQSPSPGSA